MENEINPCIKCTVHDCIYNNLKTNYCTLEKIKISVCNPEDVKESTMCDSYSHKTVKKKRKR